MADYYINSDKGKEIANSMKAGEVRDVSDGSTWIKNSDGSFTIWKNGQKMNGQVGASPSASTTPETPVLDAANAESASRSPLYPSAESVFGQQQETQTPKPTASETAKDATKAVTEGLYTIGTELGMSYVNGLKNAGDTRLMSDGYTLKREDDGSYSVSKGDSSAKVYIDNDAVRRDTLLNEAIRSASQRGGNAYTVGTEKGLDLLQQAKDTGSSVWAPDNTEWSYDRENGGFYTNLNGVKTPITVDKEAVNRDYARKRSPQKTATENVAPPEQADGEQYVIGSAQGVYWADTARPGDKLGGRDNSTWILNGYDDVTVEKDGKTYKAKIDREAAKRDPQWAVLTAPPVEEEEASGKKSKKKSSGTSSGSGSSGSLNTYFSVASTGAKKETTQAASGSTGGDIASLRKKAASAQKDMADIARQISANKARGKSSGDLESKYAEAKSRYDTARAQINAASAELTLVKQATAPEIKAAAASGQNARDSYSVQYTDTPSRAQVRQSYQERQAQAGAQQPEEEPEATVYTEEPTLLEAAIRAPEKAAYYAQRKAERKEADAKRRESEWNYEIPQQTHEEKTELTQKIQSRDENVKIANTRKAMEDLSNQIIAMKARGQDTSALEAQYKGLAVYLNGLEVARNYKKDSGDESSLRAQKEAKLSESEFSRSPAMVQLYGTYENYLNSMTAYYAEHKEEWARENRLKRAAENEKAKSRQDAQARSITRIANLGIGGLLEAYYNSEGDEQKAYREQLAQKGVTGQELNEWRNTVFNSTGRFLGDLGTGLFDGGMQQWQSGVEGALAGVENTANKAAAWALYDLSNPLPDGKLKSGMRKIADQLRASDSSHEGNTEILRQQLAGTMQEATKNHSGVGKWVIEQMPSMGNMLLNSASAGALGVSSLATLGATAGGSAYTDARNDGASHEQALAYGLVTGALEAGSEKLFGGNPLYDTDAGIVNKLVAKLTDNPTVIRILDSKGFGLVSEGLEEVITEITEPWAQALIYAGKEADFATVESVGNAFLGGVFMSAVGNIAALPGQLNSREAQAEINEAGQSVFRQALQTNDPNVQNAVHDVQSKIATGAPLTVEDIGHVIDVMADSGYEASTTQTAQDVAPRTTGDVDITAAIQATLRGETLTDPAQAANQTTQQTTQPTTESGTGDVITDGETAQRPLTQDELLDYAIQAANRGEILTSPPQRMSEPSGQNVKTMNQMGTNNAYASVEENAAARSYTHERVSNAEQFARANGRVLTDSDGNVSNYAGQVQELLASERWSNTDRDVASTLRHEAFQRGDMDSFYRLSDRITETNTEAGRTLQGTQKWLEQAHPEQSVVAAAKKAFDTNPKAPSGKMAFIEKTAREISGFGDNVSQWAGALKQIAEERRMTGVDMLVRMAEKQGENDPQWLKSLVYNGLYNVAGDYEKPTGAVDTVNKGLRRLKSYVITNQLFRVTTNAANVVSNSISNATEAAAANTGTAHLADAIMGKFTGLRSHGAFENVLGKEALTTGKNLAQKSFVEIWLDTSTEGTDSKFQSSKGRAVREYKMTGNHLFSTIDAVLSTALNTTDAFAAGVSQGAAQAALRRNVQKGYLTAEQALDVAEQRGSDTTFHNKTALGTTLQRVQAAMNGGLEYGAGNIVAGNYLNVPAAVLMREVSKMPTIGTVGALIDMAAVCIDGKTGKNTIGDLQAKITGEKLTLAQRQSRAAQQLGRSLALGTIEVAGYTALALKGIIRRIDDDDKDKAAFEAAGGQQGLYINWSALWRSVPGGDSEWQDGDVITNLGRLEPLTVNMNFGIDVAEALKTDAGLRAEDLKGISISAVQDGIADLSMIQNIQGIINALQYKGEDQSAFEAVGQELLASNVASLTPGLIQQAAKAIDPYYRDLYTGDTSGQQIYDIWANTIPGLRQQLPEKLTGFGTPKEYAGTGTERAVNAFLNPYATTTVRPKTGMESMLQEAEDVSVYPNRNPIGSVSVNGQTVTLTNKQKRQYQTVYGQTYRDTLQALQDSIAFRQLDRRTKDAAMKAAESYAGVSAKNALDIGYKPPEGYAERAEMDSTALADALILEAVKSQKYLSPETQTAKSAVESQYSSAAYARQSLDLVESAKEKAASYFDHAEQAKYGGELNEAEQELVGKDSGDIADYFMRKAIDGYKNADGTTGHLSGENAVKYNAVAKSFDTPLFSAVTDDLLVQAKKKAHAFYTEVEKTDFGGVMSADNRALNRKFAKMDNDEIAQYFLSVAAKEKYKDTNGNGTNLDEVATALKSGDITDSTVFAFLDSDVVEDYTRYGKGSSITPEILLHAARAKKTVKQDTDQDGVVVNTSQEQFEDWVNRQSWTQQQKRGVMKVFYPNTAEKKNYLVESLNSGKMKYTDAKKELTPTLQAGWTHQLLPTLDANANDTTKGALMSHYIEAAAAYDDRPNAAERKALNYSYAWQWFCDYLNTTNMTREQKYQVALIMSGTDSQKTKDKIWSRLK